LNQEQKDVLDFHIKYEVGYYDTPTFPHEKVKKLRITLVKEETNELVEAIEKDDMILIADALGDSLYVIYGTAIAYGIDLESVFKEIHRSNMTKEGTLRDDGKILKGKSWSPPDILTVLRNQK
jgi:predicted HAD superfamily Cof-like phosphohydrolase